MNYWLIRYPSFFHHSVSCFDSFILNSCAFYYSCSFHFQLSHSHSFPFQRYLTPKGFHRCLSILSCNFILDVNSAPSPAVHLSPSLGVCACVCVGHKKVKKPLNTQARQVGSKQAGKASCRRRDRIINCASSVNCETRLQSKWSPPASLHLCLSVCLSVCPTVCFVCSSVRLFALAA